MNESSRMPVLPYTVFLRRYGQKVAEVFAENVRIFPRNAAHLRTSQNQRFYGIHQHENSSWIGASYVPKIQNRSVTWVNPLKLCASRKSCTPGGHQATRDKNAVLSGHAPLRGLAPSRSYVNSNTLASPGRAILVGEAWGALHETQSDSDMISGGPCSALKVRRSRGSSAKLNPTKV